MCRQTQLQRATQAEGCMQTNTSAAPNNRALKVTSRTGAGLLAGASPHGEGLHSKPSWLQFPAVCWRKHGMLCMGGAGACSDSGPLSPASALTGQPTAALIFSQCRSRKPGFLSAVTSGMCCWNACSCCLTASATSRGGPVSCFSSFALLRHHLHTHAHHQEHAKLKDPANRMRATQSCVVACCTCGALQ